MLREALPGMLAASMLACGAPRAKDPASSAGPSAQTVEYVTEQEILTPLPFRVRLPVDSRAEHVVVLYRTWGSTRWSSLELARSGQTWTGEISCFDVSTVIGDTRYFLVALDGDGNVVGASGSPDAPHKASIVGTGGARNLPERQAPLRCHDPADCPPDFPGCPAHVPVAPSDGEDLVRAIQERHRKTVAHR